MPRVALYARVSTTDQRPEVQLEPLRDYAERRGLETTAEYVDHGVSGAKEKRPALDQLLTDARLRRFDLVACIKLDRLARSVRHLTTLAAELEVLGIDLIALDQAIDTTTPGGRLLFHTLAAVAEFERDLIRERTRAGIAAARRRGAKLGRPRSISAADRPRVGRLRESGRSLREIAALLDVSKDSVAREVQRQRALDTAKRIDLG